MIYACVKLYTCVCVSCSQFLAAVSDSSWVALKWLWSILNCLEHTHITTHKHSRARFMLMNVLCAPLLNIKVQHSHAWLPFSILVVAFIVNTGVRIPTVHISSAIHIENWIGRRCLRGHRSEIWPWHNAVPLIRWAINRWSEVNWKLIEVSPPCSILHACADI